MKRAFIIIAASLFTFCTTFAQTVEGKQKNYLPEKGDWAIGIDLKPVLNYVGNIFNGNTQNNIDYLGGEAVTNNLDGWTNNIAPSASIMAKYMISNNFALRANIGLLLKSDYNNVYVQNDQNAALNPLNETKLIDSQKSNKNGMSLMVGAEYRKGTKRVQGVFGFGALLGFQNITTKYNYANQITSINQTPSTSLDAPQAAIKDYRVTKLKGASDIFYGVTGSAGVEWFVAPKISLGAEVNLCLYGISGGQQYKESEGWNKATQTVETRYDLSSPGNSAFRLGTENVGGSLYMSFYF